MAQATIKVAYVNPPKPGKKLGSIKDENGNYYGVWPDKLSLFEPGRTYTIEFTEENGFKNFKKLAGSGGSSSARGSGALDAKAEEMFVMGFMNRCYQGACSVPSKTELVNGMLALRSAWQFVWDPNTDLPKAAAPVPQDDLNDEIPF